jgi:UDP-N-acetyl-D-glucosamine dehydrogenase
MNSQHKYDVAVVGLGYVGLPLSLAFARAGMRVAGLDIDGVKVDALNASKSYLHHIQASEIKAEVESGRFTAFTDFVKVRDCDAVVICVPTPLNKNREPDISFILDTGRMIAPHLVNPEGGKKKLVVLESTTYPGATDTDLKQVLEKESGLRAGRDFHLAFSPEREDPGNPQSRVAEIPKVMGGLTAECLNRVQELYGRALKHLIPVSSPRVAEAVKLTENIFRSVNIALVNELKMIYKIMGIDIWEVIEAAKTKPFGFMAFYPGPGLGGHCIPIDPFYLTWKAREHGYATRFIELAGEINTAMPDHVIQTVFEALNESGKPVKGAKILLLGLAYKADVDDDRESPAYVLMEKLEKKGARVFYHDPYVPIIRSTREHPEYAGRKSVSADEACDLVLIVTAHQAFRSLDFSKIQMPLVDTRNCVAEKNRPEKYFRA